jgi:hypothetical protein
MDTKILGDIKKELSYYNDLRPDSFPSCVSNQQELLRIIDLYYISRYRDGDTDNLGQKKTFYNIVTLPVDVADRELDIDTKNIRIIPEDWAYENGTLAMKMELEQWMKLKYFGRELNKYSFLLSKYGHLILKKVGNEVRIVPIQNFIFRPDAYSLDDTPCIEIHYYNSAEDFEAEARALSWDNYDLAISSFINDKRKGPKFVVYEVWFPPKMVKGSNYFLVSQYGEILVGMRKEKNLYKGLAFEELPGRLAGRGQVEKLLEEQIYLNRIANYKAEGFHWSSKNIFHARDSSISANLLAGSENGEIFVSMDKPERIDTREQNLQAYSYEEGRYESNAYRRTFSANPMSGEGSGAGVPFRSLYMQSQQAGGHYKKKRENLGMFIKEVITDWVIPDFKNENRKEHEVMIEALLSDSDRAERFFDGLVNIEIAKKRRTYGEMTPREIELSRAIAREKLLKEKLVIPKNYYDTIKYNIKIDITGEAIDSNAKMQAYQLMAQTTAQNPTIWHDPVVSRIFRKMFEAMGISALDLPITRKTVEDVMGTQQAQVGGSVPAPDRNAMPTMSPEMTTI